MQDSSILARSVVVAVLLCCVVVLLVVPDAEASGRRGGGGKRRRRTTTTTPRPPRSSGRGRGPDPDKFLEKFGYLSKRPDGVQHHPALRKKAIKAFQRMTGLTVTGVMDTDTQNKMAAPRCGLPDSVPVDSQIPDGVAMEPGRGRDNPVAYYVPGYKWAKTSLTWKSMNWSPDMYWGSQKRALADAFKVWSDITPLTFAETQDDPDIEIKFAHGEHGDGAGNAFDGPGMTLAHAFYPETGDTHFDEAETWTENTHEGTNLMIVAAHEFGHALGLGHSNIPEALMAPYYRGYEPNFSLHDDDVRAIQSLYGSSTPPTTPRPTQPPRVSTTPRSSGDPTVPTGKPDSCTTKYDAVFQAHDNRIYIFKEKWMWRLTYYGTEEEFPRFARKFFEKPPYNIAGAVYSWRTRYTYFFKGNKVWTYYGMSFISKKRITTQGYPTKVQSAFMARDGRIYLLQGAHYYVFDESTMDVADTRKREISSKWPGVPVNIEAAVRLNDGYIYFFKGERYRKFSEYYNQVMPGYPKDKAGPWMGPRCTSDGGYLPK